MPIPLTDLVMCVLLFITSFREYTAVAVRNERRDSATSTKFRKTTTKSYSHSPSDKPLYSKRNDIEDAYNIRGQNAEKALNAVITILFACNLRIYC